LEPQNDLFIFVLDKVAKVIYSFFMATRRKKTARTVSTRRSSQGLSPVMQIGVVFVIVAAMFLLMYAARLTP